jgi:hypothetical protein
MFERLAFELKMLKRKADPATFSAYIGAIAMTAPAILKARSLRPADLKLKQRRSVFKTAGGDLEILVGNAPDGQNSFEFGLARELIVRNVYLNPFKPFSADGQTVLDFGGNIGAFSLLAAKVLKPAQIVYVEPQSQFPPYMRKLLAEFPGTKVVEVQAMVGSAHPSLDGDVVDADALLAPYGVIAFAKMDIEGAEEPLFATAGPWLDKVERIAMEIHPLECDAAAVVEALTRRGFTVRTTDPIGRPAPPQTAMYAYAARRPEDFV